MAMPVWAWFVLSLVVSTVCAAGFFLVYAKLTDRLLLPALLALLIIAIAWSSLTLAFWGWVPGVSVALVFVLIVLWRVYGDN